jgi:hypothetical protein
LQAYAGVLQDVARPHRQALGERPADDPLVGIHRLGSLDQRPRELPAPRDEAKQATLGIL